MFSFPIFTSPLRFSGKTDYHCEIKETLFTKELNPTLNTNLTSDKLSLYSYVNVTLLTPRSLAISIAFK